MTNEKLTRSWHFIGAICLCFLVAFLARNAFAQDALFSKDRATATAAAAAFELIKDAAPADPIDIIAASIHLFRADNYELAAFWFYAGYLRVGYASELVESKKRMALGFLLAAQPDIDAKAMLNIEKMASMLERVLAWDETTFLEWAARYSLDPQSRKVQDARKKARDHVAELRQTLLAGRERYERQAREYKSIEQQMREKDEQIARDVAEYYSTVEVERKVGPYVLKVPLNYISAFGLKPGRIEPSELHITVMLPSLRGMTKENWRPASVEGGILRDRMIVTLAHKRKMSPRRDADGEQVERYFEKFIASAPAVDSEMGQDFYVYDARRTRLPLPLNCSDYCRILGDSGPKNSFYLMCEVSMFSEPKRSTSCAAYFLDHSRGFYLSTYVPVAYVPMWKNIRLTFAGLMEEWLVR
jgi:hypothetical protein